MAEEIISNEASNSGINLACLEFKIAVLSLIVATLTLIITVIGVCIAKSIANHQVKREEYNYLLFSIVTPFNAIETDIMLLAQGSYDCKLSKDGFDKETLLALSKAKSYAIMTKNKKLFNHIDKIFGGTEEAGLGQLIEDYFKVRETITLPTSSSKRNIDFIRSKTIRIYGSQLKESFLTRVRKSRDTTIDAIKKMIR